MLLITNTPQSSTKYECCLSLTRLFIAIERSDLISYHTHSLPHRESSTKPIYTKTLERISLNLSLDYHA